MFLAIRIALMSAFPFYYVECFKSIGKQVLDKFKPSLDHMKTEYKVTKDLTPCFKNYNDNLGRRG